MDEDNRTQIAKYIHPSLIIPEREVRLGSWGFVNKYYTGEIPETLSDEPRKDIYTIPEECRGRARYALKSVFRNWLKKMTPSFYLVDQDNDKIGFINKKDAVLFRLTYDTDTSPFSWDTNNRCIVKPFRYG